MTQSRWALGTAVLVVAVVCVALIATRIWEPGQPGSPWPSCPLRSHCGLLCPSCGATHAVGHLAAGRWLQAVQSNPIIIVLLPMWSIYAWCSWYAQRWIGGSRLAWWLAMALVTSAILYTIARNIPASA